MSRDHHTYAAEGHASALRQNADAVGRHADAQSVNALGNVGMPVVVAVACVAVIAIVAAIVATVVAFQNRQRRAADAEDALIQIESSGDRRALLQKKRKKNRKRNDTSIGDDARLQLYRTELNNCEKYNEKKKESVNSTKEQFLDKVRENKQGNNSDTNNENGRKSENSGRSRREEFRDRILFETISDTELPANQSLLPGARTREEKDKKCARLSTIESQSQNPETTRR